jgi:hypothetical protein
MVAAKNKAAQTPEGIWIRFILKTTVEPRMDTNEPRAAEPATKFQFFCPPIFLPKTKTRTTLRRQKHEGQKYLRKNRRNFLPVAIAPLSSQRVMPQAHHIAHLIKQFLG